MLFSAIDRLFVTGDPGQSSPAYRRLGMNVNQDPPWATFHVGKGPDRVTVAIRGGTGSGLNQLGLRVGDVRLASQELLARGVPVTPAASGTFRLPVTDRSGVDLLLGSANLRDVSDDESKHLFALRRLDHLAAVAHDLGEKTRYWTDTLGIPVFGEVVTPTMIVRQFKIGDAIIELLGPASQDSPIHKRPPGLVSMASWEVEDLDAAVAQARAAGFTVPDPATGVLPGTRTATIPTAELGGLAMQLLEYV